MNGNQDGPTQELDYFTVPVPPRQTSKFAPRTARPTNPHIAAVKELADSMPRENGLRTGQSTTAKVFLVEPAIVNYERQRIVKAGRYVDGGLDFSVFTEVGTPERPGGLIPIIFWTENKKRKAVA